VASIPSPKIQLILSATASDETCVTLPTRKLSAPDARSPLQQLSQYKRSSADLSSALGRLRTTPCAWQLARTHRISAPLLLVAAVNAIKADVSQQASETICCSAIQWRFSASDRLSVSQLLDASPNRALKQCWSRASVASRRDECPITGSRPLVELWKHPDRKATLVPETT